MQFHTSITPASLCLHVHGPDIPKRPSLWTHRGIINQPPPIIVHPPRSPGNNLQCMPHQAPPANATKRKRAAHEPAIKPKIFSRKSQKQLQQQKQQQDHHHHHHQNHHHTYDHYHHYYHHQQTKSPLAKTPAPHHDAACCAAAARTSCKTPKLTAISIPGAKEELLLDGRVKLGSYMICKGRCGYLGQMIRDPLTGNCDVIPVPDRLAGRWSEVERCRELRIEPELDDYQNCYVGHVSGRVKFREIDWNPAPPRGDQDDLDVAVDKDLATCLSPGSSKLRSDGVYREDAPPPGSPHGPEHIDGGGDDDDDNNQPLSPGNVREELECVLNTMDWMAEINVACVDQGNLLWPL